jgi:glycosyltransferase involved in cell wall biosynthesis
MVERCKLKPKKCTVIPNSTNVEFFDPKAEKNPGSVVYTSSPDRGLHHLLDIFPLVRARVPHANLKIFYRFWPWYKVAKENPDLIGQRARYIARRLKELGTNGENGITLVGPVDNRTLGRELSSSMVLAYPCAPVRYTEGFSIAILDACASACMPVISGIDALPSIYSGTAEIIYGPPGEQIETWADEITDYLTNNERRTERATAASIFAQKFSRQNVSAMWEKLILGGKP